MRRALIRWGLGLPVALLASFLSAYGAATLVGAVWRSPPEEGERTRTVYVFATPIHAELIVPIADDVTDWRPLLTTGAFAGEDADHALLSDISTHVAIGWGAESFYFHVHTLGDLRLRHVLDGLWDESVVHVTMLAQPLALSGIHEVPLTERGYRQLIADLEASFAQPAGKVRPYPGRSYGLNDAFFEGSGAYSAIVTCNAWVGSLLRRAGVSVGRFTPFAQTLTFSLTRHQQRSE